MKKLKIGGLIIAISVIVSVVLGIGIVGFLQTGKVYGAAVPVMWWKKSVSSGDEWIYPRYITHDVIIGGATTTASADAWLDVSTNVFHMTKVSISEDLSVTDVSIGGIVVGDLDMNGSKIVNIGDSGTDFDDNGGLTLVSTALFTAGHASISDDISGLDYLKFQNGALFDNVADAENLTLTETLFIVDGKVSISGDLQIEGNDLAFGDGAALSNATDDELLTITENLVSIVGEASISSNLDVVGLSTFTNASVSEDIEAVVGHFTTIGSDGTLTIEAFTLGGDVTGGNYDITGLTDFGTVHASISDDISHLTSLKFSNSAVLENVADSGILTITETLIDINGRASVSGDFQVESDAFLVRASVSDSLTVDDILHAAGTFTDGNLSIDGSGNITGGIKFDFTRASISDSIKVDDIIRGGILTDGTAVWTGGDLTNADHLAFARASVSDSLKIEDTTRTANLVVDTSITFPSGTVAVSDLSLAQGSLIVGDASSYGSAYGIGASSSYLLSDGTTITWNDLIVDISDDTNLTAGTNITLTGDDLSVDDVFVLTAGDLITGNIVSSGSFEIDNTASISGTLRVGNYVLPIADGTANYVLKTDGSGTLSWQTDNDSGGTVTIHGLLNDEIHTDVAVASVSRGSLVYGNATPKWAELTVGGAGTILQSDGTDISWNNDYAVGSDSIDFDEIVDVATLDADWVISGDYYIQSTRVSVSEAFSVDGSASISDSLTLSGTLTIPDNSVDEADLNIETGPSDNYILFYNSAVSKLDYITSTASWDTNTTYTVQGDPLGITGTVIDIDVASASQDGYISGTDWNTFNAKQSTITATDPLWLDGATLDIDLASTSGGGYLSSTDWDTFDAKFDAVSSESVHIAADKTLTVDGTASISGTLYLGGTLTLADALDVAQGGTNLITIGASEIIYGSSTGVFGALASGSENYVLTMVDGVPAWAVGLTASISDSLTVGDILHTNSLVVDTAFDFTRSSVSDSLTVADIMHATIITDGTATLTGGTWSNLVRASVSDSWEAADKIKAAILSDGTATLTSGGLTGVTGIVSTGVIDFGGATSTEIVNATAPTVDTVGEIALDTTDDQLLVYGGEGMMVLMATKSYGWGIASASTTFDDIDGSLIPYDFTITSASCRSGDTDGEIVIIDVYECTSAGVCGEHINTASVSCDNNTTSFSLLDSAGDKGDFYRFNIQSVNNACEDDDAIVVTFWGTPTRK